MPTPRPACWVRRPAVEKPGSRISCIASLSETAWPSRIRPSSRPLRRIAARSMPAPSSDTSTMTSDPSRCRLIVMRPVSALSLRGAHVGRLDAVHHGVAQHVLERRQHALEHLPVELAGGALDHELGALAGVGGGLAHDAREALHVALERHHARAHQAVLQLGDDARLLLQQVLGVLGQRLEQLLDAADVAGGLGERARELLDRGIAVELERVEVAAVRGLGLVAVEDLLLGLDLEVAQLFLQARDGARQLAEVVVERADLLFEPRATDADFAGVVEQLVEQLGVDARHLGAIALRHRLAARRHGEARERRREGGPQFLGFGRRDLVGVRAARRGGRRVVAGRHRPRARTGSRSARSRRWCRPRSRRRCSARPGQRRRALRRRRRGCRGSGVEVRDVRDVDVSAQRAFAVGPGIEHGGGRCRRRRRRSRRRSSYQAPSLTPASPRPRREVAGCRDVLVTPASEGLEAGDQGARRRRVLALGDAVAHARELVDARLQRGERAIVRLDQAELDVADRGLELVAQVAHRAHAGHARTALQRVQRPLQRIERGRVVARSGPAVQGRLDRLEQLGGLLGEDRRDLRVEGFVGGVAVVRRGGRRRDRSLGLWRRRRRHGRRHRHRLDPARGCGAAAAAAAMRCSRSASAAAMRSRSTSWAMK